jgi:phosphotransferase system enzyme I (PtsP)
MSPNAAVSGPREILRRLHDVMAQRLGAQAKLNKVVRTIAKGLNSEVCSIYLARDGMLELFATEGLAQEAVHVTRLHHDEGLVGTIAATGSILNLDEASTHPKFVYRPETGEEMYHSFAGVPIVRSGATVGVLCVQHMEPRDFREEEIEALQTVAMVLAELIGAAGLIDVEGLERAKARTTGPVRLSGMKIVDGIARGIAVFHQPKVEVEHTVADDVEAEQERLKAAITAMRAQLDRMMAQADFAHSGEHREILETYMLFALDEGWTRRITEAIGSGLTAEAGVARVQQTMRDSMRKTNDPYLLERLHDLDDLSNRLIRILAGKQGTAAALGLGQESILIARNLGPAELLEYDRRLLKGVVLEEGSLTAHVTIIARAMGVPMLGRARTVKDVVAPGDGLILDAASEALFVRPNPDMMKAYDGRIALRAKKQAEYDSVRDLPAQTRDGQRIALMMNAGLRMDLPALAATNADGIGLFRTEFQFLVSATLPRRQVQEKLYREVLAAAGDKPVTFRTVDIGGDKAVPYLREDDLEENPAMGWRALRVALERTGLLKVQAHALLEAAADRELNLMFPMVTQVREFDEAKAIVDGELAALRARGKPEPSLIRYGAMIEVPAIVFELDALLPRVDFVSIGTNDLVQFLFAADRSHPKLADRYDWLSVPILRFLKRIADAARAARKPVTVCGEMGGRTLEAMTLIGLGIRHLSITPAAVGPVKMMIRSLDVPAIERELDELLAQPEANSRQVLSAWAQRAGVKIA